MTSKGGTINKGGGTAQEPNANHALGDLGVRLSTIGAKGPQPDPKIGAVAYTEKGARELTRAPDHEDAFGYLNRSPSATTLSPDPVA